LITRIFTVAFAVLSLPLFTVSLNFNVESLLRLGAVKVALAVLASVNLTDFPLTSFHEYDVMLPRLLPPSKATEVPLYCLSGAALTTRGLSVFVVFPLANWLVAV
jgi:hypothetical protein